MTAPAPLRQPRIARPRRPVRAPRLPARAAAIPSAEVRRRRGPKPPDHIAAALVAALVAAPGNDPRSTHWQAALRQAGASITRAARRGVVAALSQHRGAALAAATALTPPTDFFAGWFKRITSAVAAAAADHADARPGEPILTAAIAAMNARKAAIVTETNAIHARAVEWFARRAGADQYVWTTMRDDRVRELHLRLEGTVQRWDAPPLAGLPAFFGHPGEAAQCRCQAFPVLRALPAPAPAPLPPSRQLLSATELVGRAERLELGRRAKRADVENAIDRALVGKSLEDLHAIPFSPEELANDKALISLRQYKYFHATGNVEDNFGSSVGGLPQITIEPNGTAYLSNGRHRLTVAREMGMRQIIARVRGVGPKGGLLWDYIGPIRVN